MSAEAASASAELEGDAARDRIQPIGAAPGWSENMVFQVHDASTGLALWAHWARMVGSPHVWEGAMAAYLPDGELLVSRSFGASDRDDETGGPLRFRCEEPARRWSLRFDGMARTTTTAAVQSGLLRDGPVEHLQVDLAFERIAPQWSLQGQELEGQTWGSSHIQQAGRIAGTIGYRGVSRSLDAFGFRDHSFGPRDYAGFLGDTWCTGVFPDGRALLILHVWQVDGPSLERGFLWDGETLHELTSSRVPRLSGTDAGPAAFEAEFETALGPERIEVEQLHAMSWGMSEPIGFPAGTPSEVGALVATECPARIRWGDAVAAGWSEKSLRTSHFGEG